MCLFRKIKFKFKYRHSNTIYLPKCLKNIARTKSSEDLLEVISFLTKSGSNIKYGRMPRREKKQMEEWLKNKYDVKPQPKPITQQQLLNILKEINK